MKSVLIIIGVLLILGAGPLEIAKDFLLEKIGVPSPSEISEEFANATLDENEHKDSVMKMVKWVKIIEKIPLIMLVVGIILLLLGFIL